MAKKSRMKKIKLANDNMTNFKILLLLALFVVMILSVVLVASLRSFSSDPKAATPGTISESSLTNVNNDKVCREAFATLPDSFTGCQSSTTDKCNWIVERPTLVWFYKTFKNIDLSNYVYQLDKSVKCGEISPGFLNIIFGSKKKPLYCCVFQPKQ